MGSTGGISAGGLWSGRGEVRPQSLDVAVSKYMKHFLSEMNLCISSSITKY